MSSKALTDSTVQRLLHTAIEVFAERGFRATTVREICARANVNVASVNYYFRSKEALYSQALGLAIREANERYPIAQAQDKALPSEQRLVLFIDNFLHKLLDDSHLGYHSKLITREIAEPTNAFDEIIASAIIPQFALLEDIVRQLLGPDAGHNTVKRCLLSILGQCLVFKHSRSVVARLHPELIADESAIKQTAEHIAKFSLSALSQLSEIRRD
ncbi:MAG: CerR family C-terminal domain-containing protein [Methylococcaceae bacterium]|nr:CerR family C-terminal domain-containing protein [Methylococcaceae bacterium]